MALPPGIAVGPQELISSRKGTPFIKAGQPRTYTLFFRVIVNTPNIGPNEICLRCQGINGCPSPYQMYITPDATEYDWSAFLINMYAEKEIKDDWQFWIITCEYSSDLPTGGIPPNTGFGIQLFGPQNNPSLWLPTFEWDAETVTLAPPYDMNGRAFLNSSGQPFSPSPTFEYARPVLVMKRNQLNFSRAIATNFAYAINSDLFLGAAPGTVRLSPIRAVQAIFGQLSYWECTYRFVFNRVQFPQLNAPNIPNIPMIGDVDEVKGIGKQPLPGDPDPLETWQPRILDAGTMRVGTFLGSPIYGHTIPIVRNGIAITQPVPLDGKGQPAKFLNAAGIETPPIKGGVCQAVYLPFTIYRAQPLTPILAGYNINFLE